MVCALKVNKMAPLKIERGKIGLIIAAKFDKLSPTYSITMLHNITKLL